ncbi:MAG: hypothetical protein K6A40_01395, partial [Solobacterium sp.]|nr:hypothetical protein [Solobacterium sp.]
MNQKNRRIFWCFAGVLIIGLGCALFKQSNCGNDAFTALNIRISEITGISLGTVTLAVNCICLIFSLIWGRSYQYRHHTEWRYSRICHRLLLPFHPEFIRFTG